MNHRFLVFAVVMLMALAGCASQEDEASVGFENLPVGNPSEGERLYTDRINNEPRCSDCHSLDGSPNLGPTLQGYGEIAAQRVAGLSAGEYTLQSIVRPWAHVVEGFNNIMPTRYTHTMTDQQIADLIAFIITQ